MTAGVSILIVDDEPDVCQIAVETLQEAGYVVVSAGNVHDALGLLARQKVDVVLTDIRMPGEIDGWGLAMKMKAMVPPLKVICMTGYAGVEESRKYCDAFLRKPFKLTELVAHVRTLTHT